MSQLPKPDAGCAPGQTRDRAIYLSIGTSFISKAGSLLLQVAALPLAARALGVDGFAVYTLCSGTLSLLSFADLGVGPMMVRRIAVGAAMRDEQIIGEAVFSGMVTSLLAAVVLLLLITTALLGTLPGFGPGSVAGGHPNAFKAALLASLAVGFIQLLAALATRFLAAFQLMHLSNIATAIGVTAGAVLTIFLSLNTNVQPWMMILSVFIPTVLAQTFAGFWVGRNKAVFKASWRYGSVRRAGAMILEGLGFAVFGGLVPFVEREGSKWLAATTNDTSAVAKIGLAFQLIALMGGAVTIFTSPLVAAIADARARDDYSWLRSRFGQIRLLIVCILVSAMVLGPWCGPQLVGRMFGQGFRFSASEIFSICASFALFSWVNLHWILLSSCGVIWKPALIGIIEAILIMLFMTFEWHHDSELSVFIALPLVMSLLSGWILPCIGAGLLKQSLQGGSNAQ